MSINITMPALSPTMEEGKLAKWHVKEGDTVSSGDVIAEIETDKATMEVEAVDEGKIGKIVVPEGTDNVKVNAVIAVLLQDGESAGDAKAPAAAANDPKPAPAASQPVREQAERAAFQQNMATAAASAANASNSDRVPPPAETRNIPASEASGKTDDFPLANGANGRVFASPLARRLAKEAGIDVGAVSGSGPHGRIVKADVEAVKAGKSQLKAAAAAPSAAAPAIAGLSLGMSKAQVMAQYAEGTYDIVPNDGMRKTVAARLTESKQTVPHFYLTLDCKIDALLSAREYINNSAPLKDGKALYRLSVNDFVIKAWAHALQKIPTANATWAVDSILYHKHSDVAVAVAVPGGLFTPVVRAAETKSLRQISAEVKDLAGRARSRKLKPEEYQGGSTSISNLGMYGIREFAAVINPPHGTILAVGAGEERVYAEKGQVKVANFMTVTLSCDHRAVDGALGAELLAAFKTLVENPIIMLA
jgi:pyruvate dehydrogenase E2 component (dihydrolipoamide acetyltransferase)